MFNRESPFLIAAPHGEYDINTGELVYAFCEQVRWDCLIAEGFRDDAAINVNRPTEGLSLQDTEFTERATLVYAKYIKRIRRLSPGVRFYVEIHGHGHSALQNVIDVATVGLSKGAASRLKQVLEQSLLENELGELIVRVDVLEDIHYKATHARDFGVLSFLSPAIHIELPAGVRTQADKMGRMSRVLVKSLPTIADGREGEN